jgi:hypothetical protein
LLFSQVQQEFKNTILVPKLALFYGENILGLNRAFSVFLEELTKIFLYTLCARKNPPAVLESMIKTTFEAHTFL